MSSAKREAAHREPVWRARSNFVIAAQVPDGGDTEAEQLWARQVAEHRFEVCCIPFFVFDIALGDVVETDDDYLVRRVVESSRRSVFRVWFGQSFHPRSEVAEELTGLGALLEWSSANLVAVDAAGSRAGAVKSFLEQRQRLGQLLFDTGKSA